MTRLRFALSVTVLLATYAAITATAAGRFDQKLSKQKQVVHALNRLTFGPRPGDVERVGNLGVQKWIAQQLTPHLIPENPVVEMRLRPLETLQLATWQLFANYQQQSVPGVVVNGGAVVVSPPVFRPPLAQLLSPDQLKTLTAGTREERATVLASIAPEHLGAVMSSLTPNMLEGLPELQKIAASMRLAMDRDKQPQPVVRLSPLNQLLSAEQRRVATTGSVQQRRELLMSFDPDKRKQLLRMLPPTAVAGIPELQRESLIARQPAQFVHQQLIESRIYRALYSNRQLEEVLVDFWLNHFNVFSGKGPGRMLLTSYERDAIRPHILGRFRDLLLATARHPAMLFYLDNWQSQVQRDTMSAPANARRPGLNENYGRELMELHTLGVDGGYTQADVIAVARAFTGWTIYDVNSIAEFQFNPAMHDRQEKVVLGHTIAAGGGEQDGLRVIEILARHPSTAKFIARKLAQRFVADAPPQSLVDRMAATFTSTDGNLRAVLESMFTSREFLSEGAWQAKLKSPFEMVLSAVRALDADVIDAMAVAQRIADLGQPLYGKQEPTGYSTSADAWTSSAGFLGRINFASALAGGHIDGVGVAAARLPVTPVMAVKQLLGASASAPTLSLLKNEPADKELSPASVAALVIASPDFQRR